MNKVMTFFLVSIFVAQLFAIPARKMAYTVSQPDGYSLSIRLHGDENFSFRTTEDGLLLEQNSAGYYVYCTTDGQGNKIMSSIVARNLNDRKSDDMDQLALLTAKSAAMKVMQRAQAQFKPSKAIVRKSKALGQKGIVILAQYSNFKFTIPNIASEYSEMLNKTNYTNSYGQVGSAKDYFVANSKGIYTPSFTVLGPVTLSNTRAYYGANDKDGSDVRPANQVVDAIAKADFTGIDLSEYDSDNDGYVDLVYIVYAGEGEAYGAPSETIWQHAWSLESAKSYQMITSIPSVQGKKFDYYACSSELSGSNLDGIGTFCHEYCHTLGLPDLYDTDYEDNGQSYGVSDWSVMSGGADFNNGHSPIGLLAYERDFLDWGKLTVLTTPDSYTLESLWKTGNGYKITSPKSPNEYFILENRQKEGWDSYLPAQGMLIYHVDYSETAWNNNEINAFSTRPRFRVVPADNNETTTAAGIAGDVYPGSKNNSSFSDTSSPAAKLWDNSYLGKPVTGISMANGVISFEFMGGKRVATPLNPFVGALSGNSTLFSWDPVEGATSYLVDVYSQTTSTGASIAETEPFAGTASLTLSGWTTTSTTGYTSNTNFGKASPSLKLEATNAELKTPIYPSDISAFSFWMKWQGAVSSKLQIKGLINGVWSVLTELPTSTPNGVYSLSSIPKGVRQIAIVYVKVAGNVGIDDVTVTTSGSVTETSYHLDFQNKEVTENRVVVPSLDQMKGYFYVVRSKDLTTESLPTSPFRLVIDPVSVDQTTAKVRIFSTPGSSSISIQSFQSKGEIVRLYSIVGQLVSTSQLVGESTSIPVAQPGVYLIEVGARRYKIAVR